MMEKEARTNKAGADLDKRNRNWQKINTHLADVATHGVLKTYSAVITEPFQQGSPTTINCGFKPKSVTIDAVIMNTKYMSTGYITEDGAQLVRYVDVTSGNLNITSDRIVTFQYNGDANRLEAKIALTETGFVLSWAIFGGLTGVTGNRRYIIHALA